MTHEILVDNDARGRYHLARAGLSSVKRLCRHVGWMDLTREPAVRRQAITDLDVMAAWSLILLVSPAFLSGILR